MKKEIFRNAFIKSIPILCSYLFVSMAYGIMMEEAGFAWYDSLFISMAVYTGAFQFLLITFLSSGASILTIALTAFLMNSRQTFYSLTFVGEFRHMGKRMLYMIHTMTDETYAVNLTLDSKGKEKEDTMFLIALFSRCYWMVGAVAGGILGQVIPFDLEGIDFCMTALFIIIFIDQWEKSENHLPALAGLTVALFCLFVIGEKNFMLPSLLVISGILLLVQNGGMKSE
ncbi:AzlC family ABC transporter permease [Bariatricus sp. SGI.161]|uniref:AzlC family ABC transporter permease n=1 Tax=Bariatricus sp. SGI.161 TaxID=3420550 RepID=UPI003D0422ED